MFEPAVGECYLPALLSVTYGCLPGELAILEETRTNGIWETSFVSDFIFKSGKANRTRAGSISRRMSSSTWIPNHRRGSSRQSPLCTSPCDVQSDFGTHTRTNGPECAQPKPPMVRSAVLPPLSTVEGLLTNHFSLCGPQRIQAFLGAALSLSSTNLVYLASSHIRAQSSKRHP